MKKSKNIEEIKARVISNNEIALRKKGPESSWMCETCRLAGKQCGRTSGHCCNGCYQPLKKINK